MKVASEYDFWTNIKMTHYSPFLCFALAVGQYHYRRAGCGTRTAFRHSILHFFIVLSLRQLLSRYFNNSCQVKSVSQNSEKKSQNCKFISQNCDFISQNSEKKSQNCEFISQNCEKKRQNCEIKSRNYLVLFFFQWRKRASILISHCWYSNLILYVNGFAFLMSEIQRYYYFFNFIIYSIIYIFCKCFFFFLLCVHSGSS